MQNGPAHSMQDRQSFVNKTSAIPRGLCAMSVDAGLIEVALIALEHHPFNEPK